MSKVRVKFRALEPEDIHLIYRWENNLDVSEFSYSNMPYSKYILKHYIKHAKMDIQESGQCRFIIENSDEHAIGCIDLHDYNATNRRAGVGILIDQEYRSKGYAFEALGLLKSFAFNTLGLHQLYCSIAVTNAHSIKLFESAHFIRVGVRKDWKFDSGSFIDVVEYQLINSQ